MSVRAILVLTMEPVLTNLVDSTAAVYRDSMGIDAKQVFACLFVLILIPRINLNVTNQPEGGINYSRLKLHFLKDMKRPYKFCFSLDTS